MQQHIAELRKEKKKAEARLTEKYDDEGNSSDEVEIPLDKPSLDRQLYIAKLASDTPATETPSGENQTKKTKTPQGPDTDDIDEDGPELGELMDFAEMIQDWISEIFAKYDKDGNGCIDRDEALIFFTDMIRQGN